MSRKIPARWTKPRKYEGEATFDSRNDFATVQESKTPTKKKFASDTPSKLSSQGSYSQTNSLNSLHTRTSAEIITPLDFVYPKGNHGLLDNAELNDFPEVSFSNIVQPQTTAPEEGHHILVDDTISSSLTYEQARDRGSERLIPHVEENLSDGIGSYSKISIDGDWMDDVYRVHGCIVAIVSDPKAPKATQDSVHKTVDSDSSNESTSIRLDVPCAQFCFFKEASSTLLKALLISWDLITPGVMGSIAEKAWSSLFDINLRLGAQKWIKSREEFLSQLGKQMLDHLIASVTRVGKTIRHLERHFPSRRADWLECEAGLERYKNELKSRRLTFLRYSNLSPPDFKPTTLVDEANPSRNASKRSRPQSKAALSIDSAESTASPYRKSDASFSDLENSSKPENVQRMDPKGSKVATEGHRALDEETGSKLRDIQAPLLTLEAITLLAGWCRLGQMEETRTWIKTFCILFITVANCETVQDVL